MKLQWFDMLEWPLGPILYKRFSYYGKYTFDVKIVAFLTHIILYEIDM